MNKMPPLSAEGYVPFTKTTEISFYIQIDGRDVKFCIIY